MSPAALAMLGTLAPGPSGSGSAPPSSSCRYPLEVAEAVATAQVVSGGRVMLGAGMGWRCSAAGDADQMVVPGSLGSGSR